MKRYTMTILTSVTIPAGTTSITNYQYAGCPLTSIIIPSSVTSISYSAFIWNLISSVTIPTSVTTIGTIITDMLLSSLSSLLLIGAYAFQGSPFTCINNWDPTITRTILS